MYYNYCRVHQTLRVAPAMEAGLAHHVWTIKELAGLVNARSILDGLLAGFSTPVLPFDREAAVAYAAVVVHAKAKRYTLPIADAQIAAIAKVHGFAVATRDVAPFRAAGVAVIDPWVDE